MRAPKSSRKLAFISYRRVDSDAVAGRIRDRILAELPGRDVFMDVASISAGENFRNAIVDKIAQCDVFIALIGEKWLEGSEDRSQDEEDYILFELSSALSEDARIIPVLINNARMPSADQLSQDVQAFSQINAVELRHSRFEDDFVNLARVITGDEHFSGRGRGRPKPARWKGALWGAVAGAVVGFVGLVVHFEATGMSISARIGEAGAVMLIPACALAGGALGYWRVGRGQLR